MIIQKIAATFLGLAIAVTSSSEAWADNTRDRQWHLGYLAIERVHELSQGRAIIIGLIDSGVDDRHPDLLGNILPGIDLVRGGAGNGLGDADGHGTGMAGLMVAHGHGSGEGALGIAPASKVLSIRLGSPSGNGTAMDVARGIDWAIEHDASIICIANSGGSTVELLEATERAMESGVVVVAGVGNRPESSGVGAPASFPGVLAVAAIDESGQHHASSVTGPELVLSAPGTNIVSTSRNSGYRSGTGTSDATAIVAGAAALVRAKYPNLPADEVIHRLTATATDKGPPGRDDEYGYGVLNLVAALTADVPPLRAISTEPSPAVSTSPGGAAGDSPAGTAIFLLFVLLVAAGVALIVVRKARAARR